MGYEIKMPSQYKMPIRQKVEGALLWTLLNHNRTIKEFGTGKETVEEIANYFNLTEQQRTAYLETTYHK